MQQHLQKSNWRHFFAEHNITLNTTDHLIDLLKHAFPDSEILKNCYLKRTKMKETIAEFEKK